MFTSKFKKNKRPVPLRRSMMITLVLFWLIPTIVIVTIFTNITTSSIYTQIVQITSSGIEQAVDSSVKSIESVIHDSTKAKHTSGLKAAYSNYKLARDTGIKSDIVDQRYLLSSKIDNFLSREFLYIPEIKSAYFTMMCDPDEVYGVYNNKKETYNSINYYEQIVNEDVMKKVDSIGDNVEFMMYGDGAHLYMIRTVSDSDENSEPYAMLALELDQDILFESLKTLQYSVASVISLNGIQINLKGNIQPSLIHFSSLKDGVEVEKYSKDYILCKGREMHNNFSLDYYFLTNIKVVSIDSDTTIQMGIWVALLIAIMTVAVFVFFKNRISNPLSRLTGLCRKIETGYFGATVNPSVMNSEELTYLCTQLNTMSKQLQYQFNKIYEEEISLRDARIKALQGQINPHFLGNTLEIINWEVRMEGNDKAANMLEALSTMLDGTLDRNKKPLIHLSEELMYVNAYLTIIKERMGKRLTITREIDESLLDWYVPRLILQPIVENAIEHGADQKPQSELFIRAYRKDLYWIVLEIENDSPLSDRDEEKIEHLLGGTEHYFLGNEENDMTNIGIKNVNQRLHLLYGEGSGLSFTSKENGNTVVTILIADTTQNANPSSNNHQIKNERED